MAGAIYGLREVAHKSGAHQPLAAALTLMGVGQGARGGGVDAGRPLPITNSNETALVLRSVMSSVQRLVDQNRRCRLENVRACPLPSPRH
jgi:hypothetical protein